MSTAGSLEGICCRKGRISSMTYHLSRYSRIFPRHTREFTRTYIVHRKDAYIESNMNPQFQRGNILTYQLVFDNSETSKKNLYLCTGMQPERYKLKETHSKRGGL